MCGEYVEKAHSELKLFNFDTYERFSTIAELVASSGIPEKAWVLDVGGRPGVLGRILQGWRVVTADLPAVAHKPYVRASGAALPFSNQTFAITIASDTLEHVPPQYRENFLEEVWRVTADYSIISGPYNTPCVNKAEDLIRDLEKESPSQATEWLSEHKECGLPDLQATAAWFTQRGASCMVIPGSSVVRWFLLFAAQSLLEGLPGGAEALKQFMPGYNMYFCGSPSDAPAYRHLLFVSRKGAFPPSVINALGAAPVQTFDAHPRGEICGHQIEEMGKLFESLGGVLRAQSASASKGGGLEQAYVDQMEKALQSQEARLKQLEAELKAARNSPGIGDRIVGKIKRLSGR